MRNFEKLEELINHHNDLYFNKNAPEISDFEFDLLVEELKNINPKAKFFSSVGVANKSNKIQHKEPMLSLDKCYSEKSLFKWLEKSKLGVIGMPKIDGVACSLRYNLRGVLELAVTRGDGKFGENITPNVRVIKEIPNQISTTQKLEIRGEVYLTKSRFEKEYAKDFVNPRNLTAGALKQKDAKKSAAYGLSFFPYDVRGDLSLKTEIDKFEILKKLGFITPEVLEIKNSLEASNYIKQLTDSREELNFEIDGLVFRVLDLAEQKRFGYTAHHPKYAMAYKFQDESAETRLNSVTWSLGRMGTITPVAEVEPTFVGGAEISRVSLHNIGWLENLGLSVGATVSLVRRGGVIPYIEKVLEPGQEEIEILKNCPSCNSKTLRENDFLICSDTDNCPAVIENRLIYFCSALDIKGFGPEIIKALVARGLLKTPADLYKLKLSDLMILDRMAKKSSEKLLKAMDDRRDLSLAELITSLGFEEVGPSVVEAITAEFKSLDKLKLATKDQLLELYGVGESIADSLLNGLEKNKSLVKDLLSEIKIIEQPENQATNFLTEISNKSFVFTGKLNLLDRKSAQKKVQNFGGKTPSSVTKALDYLVVGDGPVSSKQVKANKLITDGAGLKVISEQDFIRFFNT